MQLEPGNVVYARDQPKQFYVVNSIKVVVEDINGHEFQFDKNQLLYVDPIDFYKQQIQDLKSQVLDLQRKKLDITYQAN
jgi:hypothetical protein